VRLTVRANRELSPLFRVMELSWPAAAGEPRPGQFVMVRTREGTDPVWRRPLGVHDFRRRGGRAALALLYEVVGPTTRDLAGLRRGTTLDLLGPFGRGFPLEDRERWMISGGRGVAPFLLLARLLRGRGVDCRVFLGGRSDSHVVLEEEFARLGCEVEVATDDGSRGRRGFVTAPLELALDALPEARRREVLLSACGPHAMLAAVARVAAARGVDAEVSVDPLMGCGHGLCLGCTVPTRDGNRLACQHGPVFRADEVAW